MDLYNLLIQLKDAFNAGDIESLVACFDDDYISEQPVHPDRNFRGSSLVYQNWSSNFKEMPDFSVQLLNHAISGDHIWAEWDWKGTRKDISKLHMRGVTIFGVKDGKIHSGQLYMEPVASQGPGIELAVREVMQGKK